MSDNQVTEIELNIKEAESLVNLGKALDRLHSNRDFKKLILEGFFKDEAVRLVHLKADPSVQNEKQQAAILRDIDGIGVLRSYFGKIYQQAAMADAAIEDGEKELEELRAEGAE